MNVIDLFCGCGGISEGFRLAGFNIVGGIDFNDESIKTYQRNFPNAKAIMYGPHSFIFVDGVWRKNVLAFPSNCFYNVLCNWVKNLQEEFGGLSMVTKPIPFALKFSYPLKKGGQDNELISRTQEYKFITNLLSITKYL